MTKITLALTNIQKMQVTAKPVDGMVMKVKLAQ